MEFKTIYNVLMFPPLVRNCGDLLCESVLLLLFLHRVRKYMMLTLMLGYKRAKLAPGMGLRHWLVIIPQLRYQVLHLSDVFMYFSFFFFIFFQALQKNKKAEIKNVMDIFHWLFYQQHMKNPKGQKQLANQ